MSPEWEMAMGMDFGMGMGMGASYSTSTDSAVAAASPAPLANAPFPAHLYGLPSSETLLIDDLLDFSSNDLFPSATSNASDTIDNQYFPPTIEPSWLTGSYPISTISSQCSSFDLYIPHEEVAELEWLSKFVEDSFSDVPFHSNCMNITVPSGTQAQLQVDQSVTVARVARSKRSRASTGATATGAALSSLVQPPLQSSSYSSSSSSSSDFPPSKPNASNETANNISSNSNHHSSRDKKGAGAGDAGVESGVRRCTHCASEKTPQWRTGPLGPKTLCNACGVRYKSGRLVPEYRPAASPTFVLTQHSNSHRKVMELRRQKELLLLNNAVAASLSTTALPELLFDDYLSAG